VSETPSSSIDSCILNFLKDTGRYGRVTIKKYLSLFIQEDNSTSRRYGGTGLGLYQINFMLMNSKLQLKSKVGEGSDFSHTTKKAKANKSTDFRHFYQ
jgi:signal transduction histidine kinase